MKKFSVPRVSSRRWVGCDVVSVALAQIPLLAVGMTGITAKLEIFFVVPRVFWREIDIERVSTV